MAGERRIYSQTEIDTLISCAKVVSEAPRREMKLDRGHFRSDFRLKSLDGQYEFRAFARRSEDFPENFSIGLAFQPKDGSGELALLRCNGPHGYFNGTFDAEHPHFDFHVHKANADHIAAGMRPERDAAVNRDFASYEEALQYFLRTVNVTNAREHFADFAQGVFPFAGPEPLP